MLLYRPHFLLTVRDINPEMSRWTFNIALNMTNLMVNSSGVSRLAFSRKTDHTDSRNFGKGTPAWKALTMKYIVTRSSDCRGVWIGNRIYSTLRDRNYKQL
jgi:hypothetical protein